MMKAFFNINRSAKNYLLALLAMFSIHSYADIVVNGFGEVEQKPNLVSFSVSIETKHQNAKQAAEDNAKLTDKAINVLKSVIKDSKGISTQGYNLYPEYKFNRQESKSEFIGFKAVNTIYVKTKQINIIGEIMDRVIASGITSINNLSFSHDDPESLYQNALTNAINNGLDRARVIARSSALEIDRIFDIKVQDSVPPSVSAVRSAMMLAQDSSVTTPINAPDIKISANVELTILTR